MTTLFVSDPLDEESVDSHISLKQVIRVGEKPNPDVTVPSELDETIQELRASLSRNKNLTQETIEKLVLQCRKRWEDNDKARRRT